MLAFRDGTAVSTLDDAAAEVHRQVAVYRRAEEDAYEAQLATGRVLAWARHQMKSDQEYGAWFRAQEFGFSVRWGNTLARAAEREEAVRAEVVGSQLPTGARPNLEKALKAVSHPPLVEPRATIDALSLVGRCRLLMEAEDAGAVSPRLSRRLRRNYGTDDIENLLWGRIIHQQLRRIEGLPPRGRKEQARQDWSRKLDAPFRVWLAEELAA